MDSSPTYAINYRNSMISPLQPLCISFVIACVLVYGDNKVSILCSINSTSSAFTSSLQVVVNVLFPAPLQDLYITRSTIKRSNMNRNAEFQVFDTGDLIDADTGETVTPVIQSRKPKNYDDCETGEYTQVHVVYQRSKFRVPRSALKLPVFDTAVHDSAAKKETDSLFDLPLLVLPLFVFLPGWAIILYAMVEMVYHNWSHSQGDFYVPCKTPMRILFDAKCAMCVAKKQMQKVGKLQDERTLKINSRRILNYDYAQFGIGS